MQGQLSLFENKENYDIVINENKKSNYDIIIKLHNQGYGRKRIAKITGLDDGTIFNAIKDNRKETNTYNSDHVDEKYDVNEEFIKIIKPKSVLDLFCGEKNFYKGKIKNVTSNDENKDIEADYNMKALKCLCQLYLQDEKYDLVDLDPYGNSCDCFDLAIKMAKKGLIITFGETANCKRFKKHSFVMDNYNLTLADYNIDNIIKHVQTIGRRNKKYITPVFIREWKGVYRVWFKIQTYASIDYQKRKNKK